MTDRSIELYERALTGARSTGDFAMENNLLGVMAMAQDSFDHDLARTTATSAVEIGRAHDSPLAICQGLLSLAGATVHNRPDAALPLIEELLALADKEGLRWYQATGLRIYAHALSRAGRLAEASTTYADALALNGVGDYGELLWYTVLNVIDHLNRTRQQTPAAVAMAAIRQAPAAPSDDQIQRALARLEEHLRMQVGSDDFEALEIQASAMTLASFLIYLDEALREHASSMAT